MLKTIVVRMSNNPEFYRNDLNLGLDEDGDMLTIDTDRHIICRAPLSNDAVYNVIAANDPIWETVKQILDGTPVVNESDNNVTSKKLTVEELLNYIDGKTLVRVMSGEPKVLYEGRQEFLVHNDNDYYDKICEQTVDSFDVGTHKREEGDEAGIVIVYLEDGEDLGCDETNSKRVMMRFMVDTTKFLMDVGRNPSKYVRVDRKGFDICYKIMDKENPMFGGVKIVDGKQVIFIEEEFSRNENETFYELKARVNCRARVMKSFNTDQDATVEVIIID